MITDAVILMAGTASRLRGLAKPLMPINQRPLISYTLEALEKVGVQNVHAIVGPNGEELAAALAPLISREMNFHAVSNPNWQKQNGVSLLAAAGKVRAPFFLVMGDHLFDAAILERMIEHAQPEDLNLAVDAKIDSVFDLDDAMKVQTENEFVVAIGKTLSTFNAIDTGIFICPESIFDFLHSVLRDGDCSLADGVRAMAQQRKVRAIHIGEAWWQDVDTPAMLQHVEEFLTAQTLAAE